MLDFLQNLKRTTYHITLRAEANGMLPGFTGSTLRGAFGGALWRLNCRDARPFSCGESCNCVVGRLWLPQGRFPEGYGQRYQNAPKPFALEAPYFSEPQFYQKGDTLRFGLTLLGDVERSGAVHLRQGFFSIQQTCPQCRGAGKIIPDPCATCAGAGKVKKQYMNFNSLTIP